MRPVLAFLVLSLCLLDCTSAQVPAQTTRPAPATPVAVERNTVLQLQDDEGVVHVASGGLVIVSRRQGRTIRFTLHDLKQGTSMVLPFEAKVQPGYRERYYLRVDGHYVLFSDLVSPRLSIFNIQTGRLRYVNHPGGIINYGSVSPKTGDVLYEVWLEPAKPRTYLQRVDQDKPIFIAKAMRGQWSPDGQFFILKKRRFPQKHKTQLEIKYWDWWVYSKRGEPLLNLSAYGRSGTMEWAPTSDKLVYEATFDKPGFYIIYLDRQGGELDVAEARYIKPPDDVSFEEMQWSPDGSKLAFTVWYPGDETGDETELRVLTDQTYRQYVVGLSRDLVASYPWAWASPQALYVQPEGPLDEEGGPLVSVQQILKLRLNF